MCAIPADVFQIQEYHAGTVAKYLFTPVFTVLFMLIGFIIFGSKHTLSLNWSFAFCVIGAILCCAAGVLSIVHMKKSNVF